MRHGNEVAMEDLFAEEFNLEQMEAETEAMLALNYLDRSNSTFHRTEGGFVSLDTQEKHYNRVQVFRTFPFTGKKYVYFHTGAGREGEGNRRNP